jgi:transcription elongation factor Elf1
MAMHCRLLTAFRRKHACEMEKPMTTTSLVTIRFTCPRCEHRYVIPDTRASPDRYILEQRSDQFEDGIFAICPACGCAVSVVLSV